MRRDNSVPASCVLSPFRVNSINDMIDITGGRGSTLRDVVEKSQPYHLVWVLQRATDFERKPCLGRLLSVHLGTPCTTYEVVLWRLCNDDRQRNFCMFV